MVVDKLSDTEIDRLFQALADSTRRDIVARVMLREASVSQLATHYSMSFAAVQKHVAVLERATLVTKHRRGREQLVHGNPPAIDRAKRLLDEYEAMWRGRVERIGSILDHDDSNTDDSNTDDSNHNEGNPARASSAARQTPRP